MLIVFISLVSRVTGYTNSVTGNVRYSGSIYDLADIQVDCGNYKAIGEFHYKFSSYTATIEFTCVTNDAITNIVTTNQTPYSEVFIQPTTASMYLDKQPVYCPEDYVLQSFRMVTRIGVPSNGGLNARQISYVYNCVAIKGLPCKSYLTKFLDSRSELLYILEQLYPGINDGTVMKGFQLQNTNAIYNQNQKRFAYSNCELRNIKAESDAYLLSVGSGTPYAGIE